MEKYNKTIGRYGEDAAETYLRKMGYRILNRNFFIRGGEIDIIAQKDGYIVFVEVKTRSSTACGTAAEAVTYTKMQRMHRAAQVYLLPVGETDARFDVMEVYGEMRGEIFHLDHVNHIENAF